MTSRDFAFWLQGFFEVNDARDGGNEITDKQIDIIKKHLNLVFLHEIDPSMGDQKHQDKLNKVHSNYEQFLIPQGSTAIFPNENDVLLRC